MKKEVLRDGSVFGETDIVSFHNQFHNQFRRATLIPLVPSRIGHRRNYTGEICAGPDTNITAYIRLSLDHSRALCVSFVVFR